MKDKRYNEMMRKCFDNMDYNNQRQVILECVGMARANEDLADYDYELFFEIYKIKKRGRGIVVIANQLPLLGSDRLKQMIQTLERKIGKMQLNELLKTA